VVRSIWKWTLESDSEIAMPLGAMILDVQVQDGEPQIWALVDPLAKPVKRRFKSYGTGHTVNGLSVCYVGTFQLNGGSLVFHVFEML